MTDLATGGPRRPACVPGPVSEARETWAPRLPPWPRALPWDLRRALPAAPGAKLLDARESARQLRAPGEPPRLRAPWPDFQATEAESPVRVQGRSKVTPRVWRQRLDHGRHAPMAPAPGCGAAGRAAGGRGHCGRRPDRGSTPSRPLRAPPREEAGASASCSPVPQPYPSPATTGSRKPTGCARQAGAGVQGSQSGVGRRPRPSLPVPSSRISETNGRLYPRGSHCGDWTAGYERGAAFYKNGTEGGGAAESPALSRRASSTLRPPGSASPAPARQRLAPALLGMNPAGLRTWDGDRERLGPLPFGVESLLEAERWVGSEPVQPQEERPRGAAESRAWFPPASPSSAPRKCPVARSRAARGARLAQARRTRARKALSFVTSGIAIY